MSSSDNTTALAENKVLILYILNHFPNGVLEDGLYKIISSVNDVNYFYFKEVLTDLLDSKLVGLFTKDEDEESVLKITSEGKNALSLTIDVLPGILKLKADNVLYGCKVLVKIKDLLTVNVPVNSLEGDTTEEVVEDK